MGLGGAFTVLTGLGFLPGAKIATDVTKSAIKSSVKKQTDNLITPKRQAQIDSAKTLEKGERRKFLKEVNRPVPKVFHGSPQMSKITAVTQEGLDKTLLKMAKNIERNKNALLDSLIDLDKYKPPKRKELPKNSTLEQREKLRYEYDKNRSIAKNKARKDRVSIDELLSGPSVYITKPIKQDGGGASDYIPDEGLLSYEKSQPDFEGDLGFIHLKVDGKIRGTISIGADGKVSTQDLLEKFNELNQAEARKSGLMDLAVQGMDEPASKAEKLVQEGFQPYDKFKGDVGLGRRQATGEHMELDKKMLSTSRDPLVSLKEGFGEFNPANVVYADLKRSKVKGLSAEDYTDARNYRDASKLSDEPLGLPKSDHLEAEVALSKPEQLGPIKRLSDKNRYVGPANQPDMPEELYSYRRMIEEGVIQGDKSRAEVADAFRAKEKKIVNAVNKNIGKLKTLEDKVLAGQQIANSLKRREQLLARRIRDDYYFPKDMRKEASKKVIASKYYDDVRSYFNDLQSLGQFTEQYGARGTYDKLLEGLSKEGGILGDIETNLFFIRKDLPKEKAENLRIIYNILQRRSTMSSNATLMSDTAGRGITDQQLLKSAKDENLGVFKDAKTIIKRKDGTEKTVDTPRVPDMTGDSEFINGLDYNDLKRLLFLTTQRMNRGGLVQMEKGGVVPMKNMEQQMELFADGGLMDEGGMVDEESGNEVPSGSLREEVRDDIPAQLSEGEFVFPADVVRYFGLEKLMQMRQEAKAGLARMEAMGQMGNADEATLPDDLPFTIDDLDMEDDGLEMAQGGIVQMANGGSVGTQVVVYGPDGTAYNNPAAAQAAGVTNYTLTKPTTGQMTPPQAAAPVQAASAQQVQPGTVQLSGTRFTPTAVQGVMPTFQETIGAGVVGVDYEMVDYVNEAGQVIQLRRSRSTGEMLDPIPEGYTLKSEQVESAVTTPTTVGTARVTDTGYEGRDETDPGGTTDVTGVGYDRSKVNTALSDAISKYGANFGTLSDVFLKGPAQSFSKVPGITNLFGAIKMESTALANAATSAAFGGVLDNIRGVVGGALDYDISRTGAPNRQYTDTTPLDQMDERIQGVIAGIADVVMPEVQSLFQDSKGNAIESSKALSNVKAELSRLGLRPSEINKLANKGGNFNQLEKLTRALGNLKVQEIQKTTNPALIDRVSQAVVAASEKAKAAEAAGNVARGSGPQVADTVARDYYSDFMSGNDDNSNNSSAGPGEGGSGVGVDATGSTGFGTGTDCLTEDMKVKINGVVDFVTNVKVGDIIDNYRVKEVLHKHMREGYYSINNELKISNDHPVLANGTWTRPEDLVVGDSINGIPVSSLEYVEQLTPTVSIVIDGESFDVHTENNIYTVHGRYKEIRQQAA
jgi:hypothetical protein